jgi:Flp pilus assembly protein TadB
MILLQRLLSAVVGLAFVVAVFLFTSLLVALALTSGLLLSAWLWWRGRRRGGHVIEGEFRVERDTKYHLRP